MFREPAVRTAKYRRIRALKRVGFVLACVLLALLGFFAAAPVLSWLGL